MSQMPPFGPPVMGGVKPHRGTLILVLGILSLVLCGIILGPIAWIMGNADMKEIRAGRMDRSGEGATNAGRICGMIATILHGAVLCLYVIIVALAIGVSSVRGG